MGIAVWHQRSRGVQVRDRAAGRATRTRNFSLEHREVIQANELTDRLVTVVQRVLEKVRERASA